MNKTYRKLYNLDTPTQDVFIISNANILFYLSDYDKYSIYGKNFIIGATEIILNHELGIPTNRLETVVIKPDTNIEIKKLSTDSFLKGLNKNSILYNLLIVLSKQISLIEKIVFQNQLLSTDETSKNNNNFEDECIEYYQIINNLKSEYNKRKLPWLLDFITQYETSITYKKGEIFSKQTKPANKEKIITNGNNIEYSKGAIICKEDSTCKEMFILQSGTIDVYKNNQKIESISEIGTPLCENSLLHKEVNSTTLIAKNNVLLTKIDKNILNNIIKTDITTLKNITFSLAKKHYNSILTAHKVNSKLIEKNFNKNINVKKNRFLQEKHKAEIELSTLKKSIEELTIKNDAHFLK